MSSGYQIIKSLVPQVLSSSNPQVIRSSGSQVLRSSGPQALRSSYPQVLNFSGPQVLVLIYFILSNLFSIYLLTEKSRLNSNLIAEEENNAIYLIPVYLDQPKPQTLRSGFSVDPDSGSANNHHFTMFPPHN